MVGHSSLGVIARRLQATAAVSERTEEIRDDLVDALNIDR
jgi:hypothetical protein